MSEIGRVAAVAVVAALCAVLTRKAAPEFAIVLALAAGAMILAFCGGALSSVLDFLDDLAQTGGLSRNCRGNENRSGNLPGRPRRRTGWNRGDGRNHFGPVNGSSVAHRSPVYLGGVVMTDGSGAA